MRATLILIVATFGCVSVDTTPGKFRCDREGATCPTGLRCLDGVCKSPLDDPDAPDLAVTPDLAQPAKESGCAGPGFRLYDDGATVAFACTGRFDAGKAAALCRTGYHLCTDKDPALRQVEALGRCDALPGFYAAQVAAALREDATLACETAQGGDKAALIGCGADGAVDGKGCGGLHQVLACDAPGWGCGTGLANASHDDAGAGGVLCCK